MLYIDVPYSEKDEAKELGAQWDPKRKSWYVRKRGDYYKFHKWIRGDKESARILCDYFYVVEGKTTCYKCHKETEVIGFAVENYCCLFKTDDNKNAYAWGDKEIHIASHITPLNKNLLSFLNHKYGYHMGYSKTVGDSYLANHCKHCKALQGDYFLFSEVDSPFFINSEEAAKNLKLYRVNLDEDIMADVELSFGLEDYLIKKYAQIEYL